MQAYYFVAGLPALLVFILLALLSKPLGWLGWAGPYWVNRQSKGRRKRIYALLIILAVSSVLYIYVLPLFDWFSRVPRPFLVTVVYMLILVATSAATAVLLLKEAGERRIFYVLFGIALLLVVWLTLVYILIVGYVRVPQQLRT